MGPVSAWIMLCLAVAIHVSDEAFTGFLSVYNPTVLGIREKIPWLPLPVFRFKVWLGGLALGIALMFLVSPLVARGVAAMRWIAMALAVIMAGNSLAHILGTVMGRTISSVHFPRPMPGFYSSPLLLAGAINLWLELRGPTQNSTRSRGPAKMNRAGLAG